MMVEAQLLGTSIVLDINIKSLKEFDFERNLDCITMEKDNAIAYLRMFHRHKVGEFILNNIQKGTNKLIEFRIKDKNEIY